MPTSDQLATKHVQEGYRHLVLYMVCATVPDTVTACPATLVTIVSSYVRHPLLLLPLPPRHRNRVHYTARAHLTERVCVTRRTLEWTAQHATAPMTVINMVDVSTAPVCVTTIGLVRIVRQ